MSVALSVPTQAAGTSILSCVADPPVLVSLVRMMVVSRAWRLLSLGKLLLRL